MSSTNKTENLQLSQFLGTDIPDWRTDYNGDMTKIDAAYKGLEDDKSNKSDVMDLEDIMSASSLEGKIASAESVKDTKDKSQGIVSDKWDPETQYSVGDYCIDEDNLWECLVANRNTKPIEGATWKKQTIISALNSNLVLKLGSPHTEIITISTQQIIQNESSWKPILEYTCKYAHSILVASGVLNVRTNSQYVEYFIGIGNKDYSHTPVENSTAYLHLNWIGEQSHNAKFALELGVGEQFTYEYGQADIRGSQLRIMEFPIPQLNSCFAK